MSKKVDFRPKLRETSGCHENVKNDGLTVDISNFPRRMNEQLMNVQLLRVNRLFKFKKKNPIAGIVSIPLSPLHVRGLSDVAKSFAFIELPLP